MTHPLDPLDMQFRDKLIPNTIEAWHANAKCT